MGWGYWSYPHIPVVDRFKFLSHGRFLTNVCDRWAKSKTDNLQFAWFNGDGYESWENVWGTWNGITPYDAEAIRRIATMLRFFGRAGFLQSTDWEPHTLDVWQADVYASKWPLASKNSTLWTIANRGSINTTAGLVVQGGRYYYDCYLGAELTVVSGEKGLSVTFPLEAHGFGCVVESDIPAEASSLADFLATMKGLTERSLHSYSAEWRYLKQRMVDIPKTALVSEVPLGMAYVPKGFFNFESRGVMIEGDDGHGVDVQFPWEEHPQKEHSHHLELGPFYVDKFPVTTANYSVYLQATGFRPTDSYNWLKNWNGRTTPPSELLDVPVTYVGIDEARAYCTWKGGRLPHSYEWQYAAQGTDGRTYPWGSMDDQSRYPKQKNGNRFMGAEPVTAHAPSGDSPFGVSDLIGNVWQYTTEFEDDHTRSVILRGGSNYYPLGSKWYFPQAKALDTHEKYLLMSPRYERAGTIGFRCLVDAAPRAVMIYS